MARRIVGLDLGAYSVKLVRLESGKAAPKFEILNVVEEVIPLPFEDDQRDLVERQRDIVLNFSARGLLEAETFAIGLSASDGQMRTMQVPFVDLRKIEAVLPGMLEAEVPFDVDDMIVSWHRIDETVSPKDPKEKPEGASIRLAFGKKSSISQTLHMLQGFSVDPRLMLLSAVAPYELVRELGDAPFFPVPSETGEAQAPQLSAVVDFGHRGVNVCIFDKHGIKISRSFLRGGKKLTEEIAKALNVSFAEAQELKHTKVDLLHPPVDEHSAIINRIAKEHFKDLCEEVARLIIAAKSSGIGEVQTLTLMGGTAKTRGFSEFVLSALKDHQLSLVSLESVVPRAASSPSVTLALGMSLACLQIHARDNRFNFRKDEFAWRGELDFLRTNSTALILWGLILVCSLTVMWFASSLVLDKENKHLQSELKNTCAQILGQKNIAAKKCLAQMKEQITANVDLGIPEFAASDVYLKFAELLPKELPITISDLDILEKKVRLTAKTASFEDVDKIYANITKIPCFVNVEKGRAQQDDGQVKFTISSDLECNPALLKPKAKS